MGDNDSTKSYLNLLKFEHLDKHISDRFLKCVVKYRSHTCNLTIGDVSNKNPTLIFPFLKDKYMKVLRGNLKLETSKAD